MPASPLLRIAATAIDALVVGLAWAALVVVGLVLIGTVHIGTTFPGMEAGLFVLVVAGLLLTAMLATTMWLVYGAVLESSPAGATLGKRACGIRVINSTGASPGGIRALVRNTPKSLVPVLLGELLLPGMINIILGVAVGLVRPGTPALEIGHPEIVILALVVYPLLPILFSKTGQGLHDRLAGTLVVKVPRASQGGLMPAESRGAISPLPPLLAPRPSPVEVIGWVALAAVLVFVVLESSTAPSPQPGASVRATPVPLHEEWTRPSDVAVDARGILYVTDKSNNRVLRFSSSGEPLPSWGTEGSSAGLFYWPIGITVDRPGNVYVASSNNQIHKLSPDGVVLAQRGGLEGDSPGQFNGATDVAVDAEGNLYVVDAGNNRIQKISPTGRPLAQWSYPDWVDRTYPRPLVGIALDLQGDIYVSVRAPWNAQFEGGPIPNQVQKLTPDGKRIEGWGAMSAIRAQPWTPGHLAVDNRDNAYVVDQSNGRVIKLSSDGRVEADWAIPDSSTGDLDGPLGITTDSSGNLYVADRGKQWVQKLSPDGILLMRLGAPQPTATSADR